MSVDPPSAAPAQCCYFGLKLGFNDRPDCSHPAAYEAFTPDGPGVRPLCVEHGDTVRRLVEADRVDGGPLRRWGIRSLGGGLTDD